MSKKSLDKAVAEAASATVEAEEVTSEATETQETKKLSRQDENWELVTFLNFTWTEATNIEGEDREYLAN